MSPAPGWEDDEEEVEERLPYYPNEGVFVHEWLLVTFPKEWSTRVRWCPEWWEHPEARAVLKAIWKSWEHTRHDDWKMAGWYRDTAYPLLDRLLSDQGPFTGCGYGFQEGRLRHDTSDTPTVRQLPVDPLPDGLFEDVPTEE